MSGLKYSIWDPTGNITALVETQTSIEQQPEVAARIMACHPEVEQVGFVSEGLLPRLRMAGGEFCGNASMCAAAWSALRRGEDSGSSEVSLEVSGAALPILIRLEHVPSDGEVEFRASILMPRASGVELAKLEANGIEAIVPVVKMQGISHIVLDGFSPFARLVDCRPDAERLVRAWCVQLGFDGLGLMFLQGSGSERNLTPLVYVPGSDTVFWEHSCASGSAAVGMYVAMQSGREQSLSLKEPGGVLCVQSNHKGETWLHGRTHRIGTYTL